MNKLDKLYKLCEDENIQIEWVNLTLNVKKTKDVQSKGIVCEGTHGGETMV